MHMAGKRFFQYTSRCSVPQARKSAFYDPACAGMTVCLLVPEICRFSTRGGSLPAHLQGNSPHLWRLCNSALTLVTTTLPRPQHILPPRPSVEHQHIICSVLDGAPWTLLMEQKESLLEVPGTPLFCSEYHRHGHPGTHRLVVFARTFPRDGVSCIPGSLIAFLVP